MKFNGDEEHKLQHWISKQLQSIHQNNPDEVAKYIMSVLRRDEKDLDSLRTLCADDLRQFLKDKTIRFVDSLFVLLKAGIRTLSDEETDDNENDNDSETRRFGNSVDNSPACSDDEDESRSRHRGKRRDSEPSADSNDQQQRQYIDNGKQNSNYRDQTMSNHNRQNTGPPYKQQETGYRNGVNGQHQQTRQQDQQFHQPHQQQPPVWQQHDNYNRPAVPAHEPQRFERPLHAYPGSEVPYGQGPPPLAQHGAPRDYGHHLVPPPPIYPSHMMQPPASGGGGYDNFNYFPSAVGPPYAPPGAASMAPPPHQQQQHVAAEYVPPAAAASYEEELVRQNPQRPPPPQMGQPSAVANSGSMGPPSAVPPPYGHVLQPPPAPLQYGVPYGALSTSGAAGGYGHQPPPQHYPHQPTDSVPYGVPYNQLRAPQHQSRFPFQHHHQQPQQTLEEWERFTLKCTNIPYYATEEQVRAHFESFGHLVELQLTPVAARPGADANPTSERKPNSETLVQFLSVANAKKCFNSPAPVLNNRFIKLVQSHFNIIPPADVEAPSEEVLESDRQLLSKENNLASEPPVSRKTKAPVSHSGLNMYSGGSEGVSNKYRRVEALSSSNSNTFSTPVKKVVNPSASANITLDSGESEANEGDVASSSESAVSTPVAAPKEQDVELKRKFDALKQLRSQQEDICRQKETILQSQVDKCRSMMEQLEAAGESESRAKVLQNLEGKIVDLQSQLRTVRQQLEKGFAPEPISAAPAILSPYASNPFRGGGRGRGGGRFQQSSGRGFSGRYQQPYPSTYQGRGGRGRGRFSSKTFYNQQGGDEAGGDGNEQGGGEAVGEEQTYQEEEY